MIQYGKNVRVSGYLTGPIDSLTVAWLDEPKRRPFSARNLSAQLKPRDESNSPTSVKKVGWLSAKPRQKKEPEQGKMQMTTRRIRTECAVTGEVPEMHSNCVGGSRPPDQPNLELNEVGLTRWRHFNSLHPHESQGPDRAIRIRDGQISGSPSSTFTLLEPPYLASYSPPMLS